MENLATEFVARQRGADIGLVSIRERVYRGWFLEPGAPPIACELSGLLSTVFRPVPGVKGALVWRTISFPGQLLRAEDTGELSDGFVVAASDAPRCDEWWVDLLFASESALPWFLSPEDETVYEVEGKHERLSALRNARLEPAVWYPVELFDSATFYGHGVFRIEAPQAPGPGQLRYVTPAPESTDWPELEMRRHGRHCGRIVNKRRRH